MQNRRENGMALATALLVLLLVSSMIVGLSWLVMTDQKLGGNNSDRQLAFYGAEAGMEAMTANLSADFNANYDLSAADITAINTNPPNLIQGIQYLSPDGTSGYQATFTPDPANGGNPLAQNHTILSGNYAGLVGLLTPYTLTVTARTTNGSEVRLRRVVQTVAIPVFQFGIFSDTDLSFFAGPNFNFGGRVHTNTNLWLAEGSGSTLTLADKVTAAGEIIRGNLANGWPTATNYTGTVNITTNPGSGNFTALTQAQGSVLGVGNWVGNLVGGLNEPTFGNLAWATYNGNIGVKETGVNPLNLTIATPGIGGTSIDLIRRPVLGEDVTNPGKLSERYYSQASLRIFLSDYGPSGACADSDLVGMPEMSPGVPVDLATMAWDPAAAAGAGVAPYKDATSSPIKPANVGVSAFPLPVSAAGAAGAYTPADGYWVQKWYPVITGCIKIDYQTVAGGAFVDVTSEILNLGYTGRNLNPQSKATMSIAGNQMPNRVVLPGGQLAPSGCPDPSPNAVIRLARLRDNPTSANGAGGCGAPTLSGRDYWPNEIYDTRESLLRDVALPNNALGQPQLTLAGAMSYVELDVNNLSRWFTGAIGASGGLANNVTGYTLYFSDRRGNRLDPVPPVSLGAVAMKTGGFGFDDFVNPLDANGCPNGANDQGEDIESDYSLGVSLNPPATPRNYGGKWPTDVGVQPNNLWNVGAVSLLIPGVTFNNVLVNNPNCAGPGKDWPFAVAADPRDLRENPPVFFRRALKLVNGISIALGTCDAVPCGLTVVAENPVYVQGDYNNVGGAATFAGAHVATAVMGDSFTFLSNNWNDVNSFAFPYNLGSRAAASTTYRTAVLAGKSLSFKQPAGTAQDFGTDGGSHNFLRYLENWGGQTLSFRGSIVSLFYNHQGVGLFKCCATVYSPPTRGYNFDTEFLTPSLLPPRTPMFRDINTVGFTQMILPSQ